MDKVKCFPDDCNGCKFFHAYDMSIDDWVVSCKKLNVQMDECDTDFMPKMQCPMNN